MTVMQLIHRLSELPGDMEVYAINQQGLYRRIESVSNSNRNEVEENV